jgi:aminoglycoside phosphotransferase (APT) family kinase protein
MNFLTPGPLQIDPEWMTGALRRAGAIHGTRVMDMTCEPVGNGLVGDSYRFALTYEEVEPDAPASVIGKFPAADPDSRRSGSVHLLYLREVSFYRELAHTLAIHAPRPYVAEIDPETDDFTLILEDLTPFRQMDQLAGCSLEDAKTAMAEAAALHAPRWGDPALESLDWLVARPARASAAVQETLPPIIRLFKDRYRDALEPDYLALVEKLPEVLTRSREDRSSPRTVQHADFRLDNVLFDVKGGARPMATLDWQTLRTGPGAMDVAYFLSAGLDPSERRQHEADLVRFYHAELTRRGVRNYDWDHCWHDYRRQTFHGILMGVFSALSVERTERGDALFLKMTRGACQQALDHQSFELWQE